MNKFKSFSLETFRRSFNRLFQSIVSSFLKLMSAKLCIPGLNQCVKLMRVLLEIQNDRYLHDFIFVTSSITCEL